MALVPITAGIDSRSVLVDTTGAAFGTAGNPISTAVVSSSGAGTVSTANSTTATLTANATFTGTGEDVSNYAAITVAVLTDQVSAVNGLQLQFSSDNSNWDYAYKATVTAFTVSGGSAPGVEFTIAPLARYARVVYTNGGVNQTVMRLQTIYHVYAPPSLPVSSANQGIRPPGAVPMVWDSSNDIYGPMRSYGTQPDNGGGSTAGSMGQCVINANGLPDRVRTAGAASGTTGTGVVADGAMVWDGTKFWPLMGSQTSGAYVQGAAAAGAAAAGNPVLIGGLDKNGNVQSAYIGTGRVLAIGGLTSANDIQAPFAEGSGADGASNAINRIVVRADQGHYNGSSWDHARNNLDATLRASGSVVVGTTNYDITNFSGRYLLVHYNVTSYGAAGTLTLAVQMKDANGLFVTLKTTTAVSTGADVLLTVGPSSWPADASPSFFGNVVLPRTIRIVETVAGNTITASGAYSLTMA